MARPNVPEPEDSEVWGALTRALNSDGGMSYTRTDASKLVRSAFGLASLDLETLEVLLHLKSRHQGQVFSYLSDLLTLDEAALAAWVKAHPTRQFPRTPAL